MLRQTNQPNQALHGDFYSFKENVDSWIKDFNGQMQKVAMMAETVDENIDNTNHNYELVQQMQQQMVDLQQEVRTLKLMQLLLLKKSTITEEKRT